MLTPTVVNAPVWYVGTKINLQEDVSTVTVQVSTDYGIAGIAQRLVHRLPKPRMTVRFRLPALRLC